MTYEAGKSYRILYQSESGRRTERTIDLLRKSRGESGVLYLRAYCRLREEERTFRADRILRAELLPCRGPAVRVSPVAAAILAAPPLPAAAQAASALPAAALPAAASPVPAAPAAAAPAAAPPAAALPRPAPPEPRRPEPPAKAKPTLGGLVGGLLGWGFGLVLLCSFLANSGYFERFVVSYAGSLDSGAAAAGKAAPRPAPRPAPPPLPALEEATIAGQVLRTIRAGGRERYEVPALGLSTHNKAEAVSAIRLPRFVEATGLTDPGLLGRYLEADLNGSGRLSFDELEVFQRKTYRDFRYESNLLALRPDEFLAAGGGDCEDFALYTAGLLRFWGWEPYLGSLGPASGGVGHAVCLSYEEGSFPGGFTYFEVDGWTAEDGSSLKAGRYVPIDYDHVGSLSDAVRSGWKLRSIYLPEEAWGLEM